MAFHDSWMWWLFAVGRMDVHKFNELLQLKGTFSPYIYRSLILLLLKCHPSVLCPLCLALSALCGTYSVSCDFRPDHLSLQEDLSCMW